MAESGVQLAVASQTLEDKKVIVGERLAKREEERQETIQKHKEERSNWTAEQESADRFHETFESEKNLLENELSQCDKIAKNKLAEKFDSISVKHVKLGKFLTESSIFLPSYEVRKAKNSLTELQTKIQERREQLLPKKKFAFKSKKKGDAVEKSSQTKTEVQNAPEDDVILADCKFVDVQNQHLEMDESINQKDVALVRLEGCTVKLMGAPSAIHINKLKNCTIFSGPVSGSIFIRECNNCTLVVACQQLRIHTTVATQCYIHVTSRAIIEDCSSVSFGPYNWSYPAIEEHYKLSGLDKTRNSWDDIDDFNWLADVHSPNWSLIPESERKASWD